MVKGAGLLLFALFIDGLQAMISLALAGVLSAVSLVPFIGVVAGATAGPLGIVFGVAMSICMSITMGGGLIAALALNDMFYPSKLVPAFFELVPGLNNGPLWTVAVLRCMMQKYKEEHGRSLFRRKGGTNVQQEMGSAPRSSAATAIAARLPLAVPAGASQLAPRHEGRVPLTPARNIDGIRKPLPANDNLSQRPVYVQKAA